jgi:dihydroorotase
VTGLETALPVILSLVKTGRLTLKRAVELLTIGPARALGLPAGTLANGARADVVVFDPAAKWTYEKPASKSKNSPWLGTEMVGRVKHVIVDGKVWE